jgi:hypothetical protein
LGQQILCLVCTRLSILPKTLYGSNPHKWSYQRVNEPCGAAV